MQKGIFLQDLVTKLGTVNNAVIQLGDIDDSGKGRKFVSKFIQPGLVKIEGHGIVLLKKETLDASLPTIVGSPVIIQHKDVTEENANELRCGVIANAYFNQPDGWYYVDGIIWDDKAQDLINKGWSVSCSYDYLAFNDEGGEENNIHYDKEFTQLNFTHLAIVDNPRYERANIVFNSKVKSTEVNNEDQWITIHPNGKDAKGKHLLLKDGETPKEAIERTYGKGEKSDTKDNESYDKAKGRAQKALDLAKKAVEGKELSQQEKDWLNSNKSADKLSKDKQSETKKESNTTKDTRRHIDRIEKLIKKYNFEPHEEDELLDELGSFEAKLDESLEPREEEELREQLFDFEDDIKRHQEMKKEEDKEKQNKTEDKQSDDRNRLETENLIKISKNEEKKYRELADEAVKQGKEIDKKIYEEAVEFEQNRQKMLQDRIDKNNYPEPAKSSGPKSSVDKEDIERTFRRVIGTGRNSEETAEILATDIFEKLPNKFSKQEQEATKKIKEHIDEYLMSEYDKKIPEDVSKIKISSDKHFRHFTSSLFISQVNEILKKYNNKTNNSKEQDMAIIEELKKLIFKVENQKENKMDSKSKILSILNEKEVDKETIEEIKNELEKIEEKEEDKKVDNEDDKEEDKKEDKVDNESEEDKEKTEDLKEEEKKDVENKCKNSVGNAKGGEFFDKINKIYNSAKKIEEPSVEYESKQARLEAGKEYFG